ncbi:hypothetical protein [Acidipropionibacterium jensenii]|uniref:hypothetical protein n=1 Tax=Acidipropionibacterium jensenii TaxID=1749 RepID=UPI000F8401A1|nr:hypothetical protein [Acidipropionibacterium jensenii]MDN5995605.1 hypothetical protein [Acidipropionibacterium jensenii]MDN6425653.1 hypothetical protein [Acidipropionibacterium jensenii]MDN6440565.1 hypothetical protein [Acidipropionibacterium jensenii]MDN6479433.1 hypothetical protein [Acidipropionibacterium jensenii]MDN6511830.1 hypothetical protein [Acidipropionibacterium jensenii]
MATAVLSETTPARAQGVDSRTNLAVAWLVKQPTGTFTTEQRADVTLGLEAAGAPADRVGNSVRQLGFLASSRGVSKLTVTELAKIILAISIAGQNPASVDGVDLVTELSGRIGTRPAQPGQFLTDFGEEFSGQAWGILALARVGKLPVETLDFLRSRQCKDGSFDADPVNGCHGQPAYVDQALALTALVAGQQRVAQQGAAIAKAVAWEAKELNGPVGRVPATAAAYLVWPLSLWNPAASHKAQSIVLGQQVLSSSYPGVVGAIGAETPPLLSDLLAKKLVPVSGLTSVGLLGMNPVGLTKYKYVTRSGWAGVPGVSAQVVASSPTVAKNGVVTVLATGFGSGEKLSVTLAGYRGTLGSGTVGKDRLAKIPVSVRSASAQQYTLRVTGGTKSAETRLVVIDPRPGAAAADKTSRQGGQRSDEVRWPQMSAGATMLAGLGLLALLAAAALVLRRSARKD